MFCEQCGTELEPEARFCRACGNQLGKGGIPSGDWGASLLRRKELMVALLAVLVLTIRPLVAFPPDSKPGSCANPI